MQIPCESQITQVTVYARGALVSRRVQLPAHLPDGDIDLRVPGVTLLLEAGSVRASLSARGRELVSVRSALSVPATAPVVGPSVQEVRTLAAQIDRAQAELQRLAALRKQILEQPVDPVLRPHAPLERIDARIDDALEVVHGLGEIAEELDARILALSEELRELKERRDAASLRDVQTPSPQRMGSGHPSRDLLVRLSGMGAVESLTLSYVVMPARFWPVYTLRITEGGKRAELLLEALVAQRTGEDWTGVQLGLSTADLLYDARLPELPSLRYGRAQPPPRKAYRPAPEGLERMFSGYDRIFGGAPPPAEPAYEPPAEQPLLDDLLEESELLGDDEDTPTSVREEAPLAYADIPPPPRMSAPAPAQSLSAFAPGSPPMAAAPKKGGVELARRSRAGAASARPYTGAARPQSIGMAMEGGFDGAMAFGSVGGGGGGGGPHGMQQPEQAPEAIEPADAWLDFDSLTLKAAGAPRRGRLSREEKDAGSRLRRQAAAAVESLAPARGAVDPRASRGRFDHRYESAGTVELPSDGAAHRVMLAAAAAPAAQRFRTVPREAAEVYREVELQNPFLAPLLSGPIDVYLEGSLLLSTDVQHVDRGGSLKVGMGIEERIRVVRNARVEEEEAGLLGGSLAITHTVAIELQSSLGHPAQVEVLDRVPVTDDKSVEVRRTSARPEPEIYKQAERGAPVRGGLLWKLTLGAGQKAQIEHQYRVLLPAKSEIIGGNRRE